MKTVIFTVALFAATAAQAQHGTYIEVPNPYGLNSRGVIVNDNGIVRDAPMINNYQHGQRVCGAGRLC